MKAERGVFRAFQSLRYTKVLQRQRKGKEGAKKGQKEHTREKARKGGGSGTRSSRKPEGRKRRRGASLCQIFSRKAAAGLLALWLLFVVS